MIQLFLRLPNTVYPLIPWVGVLAAGYALGALLERQDRRKWLLRLGVALTLAFFVLRTLNLYGNGDAGISSFSSSSVGPWKLQPSLTLTVIAFFNTLKYPPSLDYLLMTLGPALIVLACLDGVTAEGGFSSCMGGYPSFIHTPYLSDSRLGDFCGLPVSSTRLLALAWSRT